MEEWNIQKRSTLCTGCQSPFEDKASCHTILSIDKNTYRRQDLCHACWSSAGGQTLREKAGVISYWEGTFDPPPPPPPDPLPRENAESLLRKMMEDPTPEQREARYLLAVMLERKRILRHRETQLQPGNEDGKASRIMIYEHLKTHEVFMIPDPELSMEQLPAIQSRVSAMLAPAPAPATEGTPAPVESGQENPPCSPSTSESNEEQKGE